jgi:hypothetical protein
MRLPRLRFTVRRMMIAVAIAGIVAWGVKLRRFAASYRARADICERRELSVWRGCYFDFVSRTEEERVLRHAEDYAAQKLMADHYAHMQAKYDRAARYPWLPVASDPPLPSCRGDYDGNHNEAQPCDCRCRDSDSLYGG